MYIDINLLLTASWCGGKLLYFHDVCVLYWGRTIYMSKKVINSLQFSQFSKIRNNLCYFYRISFWSWIARSGASTIFNILWALLYGRLFTNIYNYQYNYAFLKHRYNFFYINFLFLITPLMKKQFMPLFDKGQRLKTERWICLHNGLAIFFW